MRDMYNNIPGFQADEILPEDDPFYDPAPWFQFVGRSYVYLRNLLYKAPFEHTTPIFSEKGGLRGQLRVEVSPFSDNHTELVQPTWLTLATKASKMKETPEIDFNLGGGSTEGGSTPAGDQGAEEEEITLSLGENLVFFVNVKEATGLSSKEMTDVFCQIRFLNEQSNTFPSNPPCRGLPVFFPKKKDILFIYLFFLSLTDGLPFLLLQTSAMPLNLTTSNF